LRIEAGQEIVRRGPYAIVRHPGYLGSLLTWTGIALTSGNLLCFAVSVAALVAAYGYRIASEEAMLRDAFGARYEAYRREVRRIVPFVWALALLMFGVLGCSKHDHGPTAPLPGNGLGTPITPPGIVAPNSSLFWSAQTNELLCSGWSNAES